MRRSSKYRPLPGCVNNQRRSHRNPTQPSTIILAFLRSARFNSVDLSRHTSKPNTPTANDFCLKYRDPVWLRLFATHHYPPGSETSDHINRTGLTISGIVGCLALVCGFGIAGVYILIRSRRSEPSSPRATEPLD